MGNRVSAGVALFNDDGSMVIEPSGRISAVGGGGGGPPTGPASGDLDGTYPGPTVDGLRGVPISAVAATAGQYYVLTGGTWTATTPPASLPPSGAASGDLSGSYPGPLVDGLQGRPVAAAAPALNDVLAWDGAQWAPAAGGGGGGVTTVTGTGPVLSSGGATPDISLAAGTDVGDVYSWNGAAFDLVERVIRATGVGADDAAVPGVDLRAAAGGNTEFYMGGVLNAALTELGGETVLSLGPTKTGFATRADGPNQYLSFRTANATGVIYFDTLRAEWRNNLSALVRGEDFNATGANLVRWTSTITSLQEDIAPTAAGAGAPRTLRSQDSTAGAGGVLDIRSGAGSTVPGALTLRVGTQTAFSIDGAGVTGRITIGPAAFAGTHNVNTSVSTSATAGAGEALPATPAGYWNLDINGAQQRVPYYNG